MTKTTKALARAVALALVALAAAACATAAADGRNPHAKDAGHWQSTILWDGDSKVQAVRIGDVDPATPGNEAVGVDYAGRLILLPNDPKKGDAKVIWNAGSKLTGLMITDLDPNVPGPEIYVGGFRDGAKEEGGSATQVVWRNGKASVRRIFEGDGFIHSFAKLAKGPDGGPELVIITYSAKLLLAKPTPGTGLWTSRVIHEEPPNELEEGKEMKDVVAGTIGGKPNRIFFVVKSGRGVLVDPAHPEGAEAIHVEPGGVARLAMGADGTLWLGGNDGRILHLVPTADGWDARIVYHMVDVNHGVTLGDFPAGCGRTAHVAVGGYSGFIRLLLPHDGGKAYDSKTIFEDVDMTHWLTSGEIVPGNDATELLLGTYANQIVLLAWVRD